MKVFRIDITAWTASFRYPNLISGVQPTLEVPPVSTVLGLLNAAAGRYLRHEHLRLGYFFRFAAKSEDLETIYQFGLASNGRPSNSAKSNIMRREFLYENQLSLYLEDETLVEHLRCPHYQILLGRSNDLATVNVLPGTIDLEEVQQASNIRGQVIPLAENYLPGQIQALPQYFTDTFPRQNLGTQPYSVISHDTRPFATQLTAYHDRNQPDYRGRPEGGVDIYFHDISF